MRFLRCVLLAMGLFCITLLHAQQDTAGVKTGNPIIGRRDSIQLAKLNTSGTLMMAGAAGLCGAGSYLVWQGNVVYKSTPGPASGNPTADIARNHQQGTAYMIGGCMAIAAGIILGAFGIKNKIEFKHRKKRLLQVCLSTKGAPGVCFNY